MFPRAAVHFPLNAVFTLSSSNQPVVCVKVTGCYCRICNQGLFWRSETNLRIYISTWVSGKNTAMQLQIQQTPDWFNTVQTNCTLFFLVCFEEHPWLSVKWWMRVGRRTWETEKKIVKRNNYLCWWMATSKYPHGNLSLNSQNNVSERRNRATYYIICIICAVRLHRGKKKKSFLVKSNNFYLNVWFA